MNNPRINEQELTDCIEDFFNNIYSDDETLIDHLLDNMGIDPYSDDPPKISARSFEAAGILTHNKGVVLGIGDNEFQITIVQSR